MFILPKLEYSYNALEPTIDAKTMEIHHSKHHQAYTDNFNKAIADFPEIQSMELMEIFKQLKALDVTEDVRQAIRNNGGGYINHKIFWESLAPEKQIDSELVKELEQTFGSLENFKQEFANAAKTQFGSGWAWLVRNPEGKLKVYALPNQDSPYTLGDTPIFNLDVWEHAYYLQYQNKRPDYIDAFWQVLKMI
jgi:superoxide dismutase, Fe-Mn family